MVFRPCIQSSCFYCCLSIAVTFRLRADVKQAESFHILFWMLSQSQALLKNMPVNIHAKKKEKEIVPQLGLEPRTS